MTIYQSSDEAVHKAFYLYRDKQFRKALDVSKYELQSQPENFNLIYIQGLSSWQMGDAIGGIRLIKKALTLCPCLENYDHMLGLIKHRGSQSKLVHFESMFVEFKRMEKIENFIISYPKCGRTWIRLVLGSYILEDREGDPLEVLALTQRDGNLPTTEFSHDDYPHWKKAHLIHQEKSMYSNKRVVFLVRDPRDTIVSYYFEYTKRGSKELANDSEFKGTISDFIRHNIGGIEGLVKFYNVWATHWSLPKEFLLLKYEDFKKNPLLSFTELTNFLAWPVTDPSRLENSIKKGAFNNMKNMEQDNVLNNARLKPPEDGDPEGFKIRRGKVGGYVDYLSKDDIEYIDQYLDANLDDFYSFYKS